MSSSNLVRIAAVTEVTAGITPATAFSTVRKISDSLSGTPTTTESEEARSDRQSAGQLQVGLEVGGDIEVELSGLPIYSTFLSSAMKSALTAAATQAGVDTLGVTAANQLTATGTDLTTLFAAGDMIRLTGFINAANNVLAVVTVVTATVLTVLTRDPLVIEADTGVSTADRPSYYQIGSTDKTFTIEKRFMDLADKSLVYRGAAVDTFSVSMEYGAIAKGTFGFVATDYEAPVALVPSSVTAATDELAFNVSSDVGLIVVDGAVAPFCIQSLNIELNNNAQPNTCIGTLAPTGYTLGTAQITVSMSAYLADSNWSYIDNKIDSTPISLLASIENADGGMAFYLPSVQLSFQDPNGAGRDQQVTLDMEGTAKYSSAFANSFRVYVW